MTRTQLAEQLRQKLQAGETLPYELLAALDDDYLVNTYLNIPCEDCGKKLAEGVDVDQVIAESRDLDDFFDLCVETKDHAHKFTHFDWPEEIAIEGSEDSETK
jgi:hypothetical protein